MAKASANSADSPLGSDLAAIILVTRSRPGPRMVFRFPPSVEIPRSPRRNVNASAEDESDDDDDFKTSPKNRINVEKSGADSDRNQKEADHTSFLGSSIESLERLLTPSRWTDGKKFELQINGMTFVGHPVFAPEDGRWNKRKPSQEQKTEEGKVEDQKPPKFLNLTKNSSARDRELRAFSHISESFDSYMGPSLGTSMDSGSTASGHLADQLTMFHVVFAVHTTHTSASDEVFAVYNDLARRLSKALQYCQHEYNYVTLETRKLLGVQTKARQVKPANHELWSRMTESSELAWTLQEIYTRTKAGEISSVRLHGMEISLQLKNRSDDDGIPSNRDTKWLSPLSGLLLLAPKDTILAELSHMDASPLAAFIRELRPTKSLLKHSNLLGLPMTDVLYMAHHLVKWRKARLLRMPLHRRNTYILSPDAPLHDLPRHIAAYEKTFPSHLPSLPQMLQFLGAGAGTSGSSSSRRPIRFGLLAPSRDHLGIYMEILAFCVQAGFVRQLMTHGWLQVPADLEARMHNQHHNLHHHNHNHQHNSQHNHHHHDSAGSEKYPQPHSRPQSALSLLSPHLRAAAAGGIDDDENASVISDRTALPIGPGASSTTTSNSSRPPTATTPTINNKALNRLSTATQITIAPFPGSSVDHEAGSTATTGLSASTPTIILNPGDPSSQETRLIAAVKRTCFRNREARELFERILPELDGEHSFEEIAGRIGAKRAQVEECLAELGEQGLLAKVRIMEGDV